ncbi:MAG: hypothetical protein RL308_3404 [Bacteroidota bacterium]|jgi:hypothetical protein
MKFNVFAILILTSLYSCKENQKNSLKEWNLNGKVESISSQTYEPKYVDGKVVEGDKTTDYQSWSNYEIKFNKEGFIIEQKSGEYSFDNQIDKFEYKDDKIAKIDHSSSRMDYTSYTTIVEKTSIFYEYENGKLSKTVTKDENGNIQSSTKFITNSKGQVLSGIDFNEKGIKNYSWENSFDGDRIEKSVSFDSSGKENSKRIYSWNSNGDIDKIKNYDGDKLISTRIHTYEYDDNKNWIKSKIFYDKEDSAKYLIVRNIKYFFDEKSASNKISESKLQGIWKATEGRQWVEFKKSNKYDWGSNEDIDDMGTYELNSEENILSFISTNEDKSKKYKIEFRDNQLHLMPINGSGERVLEKK